MLDFFPMFVELIQFIELWFIAFLLLGAFVGFIAGLLGVGGGGILVPVLATLFLSMGVDRSNIVHLALGTSMMAIVLTSFASAKAHFKHQAILWHLVKKIAPGIVLGTLIGVVLVNFIDAEFLSVFFALFFVIVSFRLYKSTLVNKNTGTKVSENAFNQVMDKPDSNNTIKSSFPAGIGIGLISALVSIGGGSLTVPYLVHHKVVIRYAIATSSAIGFVISIIGTFAYLLLSTQPSESFTQIPGAIGHVHVPAALCIGFVSLFTAHLGADMAHRLPTNKLKGIFALLLLMLSIHMLITVFS